MYLLMRNGKIICIGTNGIASNAKRSLGTPFSTNFNGDTASMAENPNCAIYETILLLC